MKYWKQLENIHQYLESGKEGGIAGLSALISKQSELSAEHTVLSFTYEHIEAYVKVNGQYELHEEMFGTLSQSEMSELASASYQEDNVFEDYEYWKFYELVGELIEMWVIACFEAANAKTPSPVPFYFKQNHDSLYIIRLNDCGKLMEKSEFEMYVQNNQQNLMQLLG